MGQLNHGTRLLHVALSGFKDYNHLDFQAHSSRDRAAMVTRSRLYLFGFVALLACPSRSPAP